MPLKNLLENALAITLNHISMTGNDFIEIPAIDLPDTPVEVRPISLTSRIPQKSLLPRR